ncbi:MAG: tetratricopeptide repeat protein [Pirellulaceae bacterium]
MRRQFSYWPITGLLLGLFLSTTPVHADDLPQAKTHYLKGRYAEARELLGESPELDQAAVLLARTYRAEGKRDEAKQALETFLTEGAPSAPVLAELADMAFDSGDLETAARHNKRSLFLNGKLALARWLDAELARVTGDLKQAEQGYEWFIDHYNATDQFTDPEALYYTGLAAAQYARWTRNSGQFHFLVNDLFPDILKLEPNYWPAHLALSRLFTEKFNLALGQKHLSLALAINGNQADLYAHRAELGLLAYNLQLAAADANRALEICPGHVAATRALGKSRLADFRPREAIELLQAAAEQNPTDHETLGYLASAYVAAEGTKRTDPETDEPTDLGKLIQQQTDTHPAPGEFFAALAAGCDIVRKYPQAVEYFREAKRHMPQLIHVHADLGMVQMRMGNEEEAKEVLEEAFKIDPFHVRVKNSLEVLDVLEKYETIETEHFLVRFDPEKDAVLAEYAAEFLEENVYPVVCESMGYEPQEKTLIEIFNQARNTSGHGWFSARMVGLPYVGTVGACAGKMIAITSPQATARPFHWGNVLRHEFVHVVNLQQTDFNIPHWYTEALAVTYESDDRPPDWDEILARRLVDDNIFNLDTINHGFIRPADGEDWTLAYCQAYYYAKFLTENYGDDALRKLLAGYTAYETTPEILEKRFEVSQEDFERRYRKFLEHQVMHISPSSHRTSDLAKLTRQAEEKPEDVDLQADLAMAYLSRKNLPTARKHANQALQVDPEHPLALYVMARLHLAIGDNEAGLEKIEQAASGERADRNALALLANLRLKQGKADEALTMYQKGAAQEPARLQWQESIIRVLLVQKDDEGLLQWIPRVTARKHHDALLRKKMADLHLGRESWEEAEKWAYDAIQIDATDPQAHLMMGQALREQEKLADAARQYRVAGQLAPQQISWTMEAARLYHEAGETDEGRGVLEKLLEAHPDHQPAQKLLDSWK